MALLQMPKYTTMILPRARCSETSDSEIEFPKPQCLSRSTEVSPESQVCWARTFAEDVLCDFLSCLAARQSLKDDSAGEYSLDQRLLDSLCCCQMQMTASNVSAAPWPITGLLRRCRSDRATAVESDEWARRGEFEEYD